MLSCILCVALAGGMAAMEPSRLEQGEAALEREEFRQAAEQFAAHYRGLPADQRASPVGEHIVMYAAEVYDKAYAKDGKIEHVEASRALLSTFVGDVESAGGSDELTQAAREKIVALDEQIASTREDVPPPFVAPKKTAPPPAKKTLVEAPPQDRNGPDRVGIALLASGGVIAAGGIAMLVAGLVGPTKRRADGRVDAQCEADGYDEAECAARKAADMDVQAFLDHAERTDRTIAIASIAPLVVGTALLIVGGVRVARRRDAQSRIGVGMWVRGATIHGRF